MLMIEPTIAHNFSAIAEHYETFAIPQRQAANDMLAFTGAAAPCSIYEPGCGTGLYTRLLAATYPAAAILGVDFSPAMLAVARRQTPSPAVCFQEGDIEAARDGCYDCITSNATLQWCQNLRRTLAGLTAMLTPGGILSFSYFGPETYGELDTAIRAVAGDTIPLACRRFAAREELTATLQAVCRNTVVEERQYTQHFPSLKALLQSIRYTGTRGKSDGQHGLWTPSRLAKIEAAYLERFRNIRVTYQVFLCRGNR